MNNGEFNVSSVTYASYKKYEPGQILFMNSRNHNGLTYIISGELRMTFPDGNVLSAKENDLILQRVGDTYRLECSTDSPAEYIVISYLTDNSDIFNGLLTDDRVYSPKQRRYRDAFERTERVYNTVGLCREVLVRALVQEILCNIIREMNPCVFSVDNPAAKARSYIEENFERSIDADSIAAAAGCSVSHLRMLFKSTYGESPMRYLNRIRIEKAKEMLSSDLFKLEETALACGFQNVYYFSRVFKSYTGISPGKY